MATYVLRLLPSRPSFLQDMTEQERATMGRHAAHWQGYVEAGQMSAFGPVAEESGSFGLAVVQSEDEAALRAHAEQDPAVLAGVATVAIGRYLGRLQPQPGVLP